MKTGFRIGRIQAKQEVKSVQDRVLSLLESSDLQAKDKAKFSRAVKNIQSFEQLQKQLPVIEERIDSLSQSAEARKLRESIKKELKATKPSRS